MPSLGYWKIRGLAQPIRLLLNYVGEEFDDVQYVQGEGFTAPSTVFQSYEPMIMRREHEAMEEPASEPGIELRPSPPEYSREEWNKVKHTFNLDFPNLPYYIDGDIKITQSNAIVRYIGRKYNLVGETEEEKVMVDIMLDQAMDFRNGMIRIVYNKQYEELKVAYFESLPDKLAAFEKRLGDNPWFAGKKISVADFHMYELLDQHKLMKADILDGYDNLNAFIARFEALPAIKTYMSSDKFLKRPINNNTASFR